MLSGVTVYFPAAAVVHVLNKDVKAHLVQCAYVRVITNAVNLT